MTDRKDLLAPVRELLSEPERWCRGAIARDADGRACGRDDDKAVAWCLVGATAGEQFYDDIYWELRRRLSGRCLSDFNDDPSTTHADIMALLAEPFYGDEQ